MSTQNSDIPDPSPTPIDAKVTRNVVTPIVLPFPGYGWREAPAQSTTSNDGANATSGQVVAGATRVRPETAVELPDVDTLAELKEVMPTYIRMWTNFPINVLSQRNIHYHLFPRMPLEEVETLLEICALSFDLAESKRDHDRRVAEMIGEAERLKRARANKAILEIIRPLGKTRSATKRAYAMKTAPAVLTKDEDTIPRVKTTFKATSTKPERVPVIDPGVQVAPHPPSISPNDAQGHSDEQSSSQDVKDTKDKDDTAPVVPTRKSTRNIKPRYRPHLPEDYRVARDVSLNKGEGKAKEEKTGKKTVTAPTAVDDLIAVAPPTPVKRGRGRLQGSGKAVAESSKRVLKDEKKKSNRVNSKKVQKPKTTPSGSSSKAAQSSSASGDKVTKRKRAAAVDDEEEVETTVAAKQPSGSRSKKSKRA
ncbi:hypothetical protein ONZ45_g9243 [Pleurotus djamor]|nr:hypothetical protein ONZ45_g9243 [Pleurotus djamor]